jgi:oligopeptide transport system substrate-binding protein
MRTILIVLVFLSLFSCTKREKVENVLNLSLPDRIASIDPLNAYDTVSANVLYQVYDTLYQYNYLKRPYTLEPLLAEEMPTISKDGKTYLFKIKKDILYHKHPLISDGRSLKAHDFINQIKRVAFLPHASSGWWLFDGKIEGINTFRNLVGSDKSKLYELEISGLKALDDYTLQIQLTDVFPNFIYALAMTFTSPIPLEVAKQDESLLQHEVGTGPFYISQWNPNQGIRLNRFESYRTDTFPKAGDRKSFDQNLLEDAGKSLPFLNVVHFSIMNEAQTRWLNFLSNKIEIITLGKDQFNTALKADGSMSEELIKQNKVLHVEPALTYWWLSFNMQDPVVGKNKMLRKAIAHAINIDEYIQLFTNNTGLKANSIFPPGTPGYSPLTKLNFTYDIQQAKTFLAQAGYPQGKGLPKITFDVRGNNTTSRQIAEFIQKQLLVIGIKIEINTNTFPGFLQKSKNGQLQFWLDGWALDYPDAENILQLLVSQNKTPGPNATNFSHPEVDQLYRTILKLNNDETKFEHMRRIEQIVGEEYNWLMLYYSRNYILSSKRVQNYRPSDIIYNWLKYIKLKED